MVGEDDDFMFADEEEDGHEVAGDSSGTEMAAEPVNPENWIVMIVDDEPEVHSMTRMLLSGVRFRGRDLEFISAESAAAARVILEERRDIAVIMLDVVMETDDAGLQLVRQIRHELQNRNVRIILRTGQPGQAPERDVILDYDINDYKSKTELTSQKLFTSTIAALRAYEDIMALEATRHGLEKVLDASATLFRQQSMERFANGVLTQLSALIGVDGDGILCVQRHREEGVPTDGVPVVLAACGRYENSATASLEDVAGPDVVAMIARALEERGNLYQNDCSALYFSTSHHRDTVVYLRTERILSDLDKQLIEVFCAKISVGFDNIFLFEQFRKSQQATVVALADLAEFKDSDTGEHVLRVEKLTSDIAVELKNTGIYTDIIDDLFLEQVGMASILHDVGKVSIPDNVLQKPGPLDPNERIIMEDHASAGGRILEKAGNLIDGTNYLSLGSEIASGHHEWYDGSGYPRGLKGDEIPLSARIVAVADVYDALINRRPYKEPWSREKAIAYIRERAGSQFDPRVVKAFLAVAVE